MREEEGGTADGRREERKIRGRMQRETQRMQAAEGDWGRV